MTSWVLAIAGTALVCAVLCVRLSVLASTRLGWVPYYSNVVVEVLPKRLGIPRGPGGIVVPHALDSDASIGLEAFDETGGMNVGTTDKGNVVHRSNLSAGGSNTDDRPVDRPNPKPDNLHP